MDRKPQTRLPSRLGPVGLVAMLAALPPALGAEAGSEPAAPATPPPIGAFTDLDAVGTIQISPTGEYLAFITRQEGNEENATKNDLRRSEIKNFPGATCPHMPHTPSALHAIYVISHIHTGTPFSKS